MEHLKTNIILMGLQKAFNVTLNLNYRIYGGPLYMNIVGPGVSKVTIISVR